MKAEIQSRIKTNGKNKPKKIERELKKYKTLTSIFRITTIALLLMVIGMFYVASTINSPNILNYKEQITNEYASWAQKLSDKESALNKRENELKEREQKLQQQEQTQPTQTTSDAAESGTQPTQTDSVPSGSQSTQTRCSKWKSINTDESKCDTKCDSKSVKNRHEFT